MNPTKSDFTNIAPKIPTSFYFFISPFVFHILMKRKSLSQIFITLSFFLPLTVGFAKPISPPLQTWVSLSNSPLQAFATASEWLRAQESGQLFQQTNSIVPKLNGIIAPAFSEGNAYYNTAIVPFAGRSAESDEKALRQLLSDAKTRKVPVYLSVDALAWQKNNVETEPPVSGIFADHPDWRETRQQGVQPQTPNAFYASPWNPEVRAALKQLMTEIGQKFPDAAGVAINLRLSDREITGFSDAARLASIRDLGLDPFDLNLQNRADEQNNALVESWRTWKLEQMAAFLKELRTAYTEANPKGKVLVWGTADYYDRQEFNDLRSGQDWRGWLQDKLADGVLLEGRWTPRYNDAASFAGLPRDGKDAPLIIPVSNGSHLVADSSYAADWSSLASRVEDLDTMAFVVRNDADVQSVVRLVSGAEKLVPPPAPKVNEPFPDFALRLPDGKSWETRDARGKTALALLLNPDATPGAERVLEQAQNKTDKVRLATVSPVSSAKVPVAISASTIGQNSNAPLHLFDAPRDVLAPYGQQTRLLLIDRAGWVRGTSTPKNAAALQASLTSAHDFTPALVVGQQAPDFMLPDMNGQMRRLSEVRGQSNLLLTFFPKCFTGGCSNHLTSLRDKAAEFEAANTKIWAVSIDPADVQIAFAKSLSLPFPLLPDTGRHLSFLYNAAQSVDDLSARQSVLIDKTGIVRWIDTDVHVQTHGADVMAKINELGLNVR